MFELHPQLAKDCLPLGRFELCQLLLMNDASYPWFILVPEREGVREIYQLSDADQQLFLQESTTLSRSIMDVFAGDKLNVAALGNMVPQLHIHHIVRYAGDVAWPAPVWGRQPAVPYSEEQLRVLKDKLLPKLSADFTANNG